MRSSGILLPIFSLPSAHGIGDFSQAAYDFVDRLEEAGQKYWQILPIGPTSYGDSPYQSFSTFAGNPYFIDLDALVEEGVLTREEVDSCDFGGDPRHIDYGKLYESRLPLLRKAYARADITKDPDYVKFEEENRYWLQDYAIFMAVKAQFGGVEWSQWAEDIRMRWQYSMDYYQRELYYEIEFHKYLQYTFIRQWRKLKAYANAKGIQIVGDIPIYVAFDSADVWANPWLFQLDEEHRPIAVAGCPPDGFSATGQLWGNPLYHWENHKKSGYEWWVRRMAYSFQLYDVVRIDHFRGFDEYYSIPYGDETAENGHWEKGPGMDLFRKIRECCGDHEIIAEDLGYMTDSVRQLVRDSGFPNMKVLEFAFDSRDTGSAGDYLPHNYNTNCVVYTGTHDNETIQGWYQSIQTAERKMIREYLNKLVSSKDIHWDFIRMAQSSVARICIIPIQDYLGLGNEARINQPSTLGGNWSWRMQEGEFTAELAEKIRHMTRLYGRLSE